MFIKNKLPAENKSPARPTVFDIVFPIIFIFSGLVVVLAFGFRTNIYMHEYFLHSTHSNLKTAALALVTISFLIVVGTPLLVFLKDRMKKDRCQ